MSSRSNKRGGGNICKSAQKKGLIYAALAFGVLALVVVVGLAYFTYPGNQVAGCIGYVCLPNGAALNVVYGAPVSACFSSSLTLQNTGSASMDLELEGWSLQDYKLPARTLAPSEQITLWDKLGQNNADNIYTGGDGRGWHPAIVYVVDPQGQPTNIGVESCSVDIQ